MQEGEFSVSMGPLAGSRVFPSKTPTTRPTSSSACSLFQESPQGRRRGGCSYSGGWDPQTKIRQTKQATSGNMSPLALIAWSHRYLLLSCPFVVSFTFSPPSVSASCCCLATKVDLIWLGRDMSNTEAKRLRNVGRNWRGRAREAPRCCQCCWRGEQLQLAATLLVAENRLYALRCCPT